MKFKLGRKSFVKDPRDLLLAKYLNHSLIPTVPLILQPYTKYNGQWGMMLNDKIGDCTCAGQAHHVLLANAVVNKTVIIPDQNVLSLYENFGYDPSQTDADGNNPTDQGAQVRDVLKYMQQTGIMDDAGIFHKIDIFTQIEAGNLAEMKKAFMLGDLVGIGLNLPDSAQDQFQNGQPWDVVPGANIEGGHYVTLMGWDGSFFNICTWGQIWKATYNFMIQYIEEAWAGFMDDFLVSGKSPIGLDRPTLIADLQSLK